MPLTGPCDQGLSPQDATGSARKGSGIAALKEGWKEQVKRWRREARERRSQERDRGRLTAQPEREDPIALEFLRE